MAAVTEMFYSNRWVYPEDRFASNEQNLKFQLTERIGISWDFSLYDWERGCSVADDVLRIILNELKNQARLHFEGLEIHSDFIRQASARQGMKIFAPTEFDAVIPYTIRGLVLQEVRLRDISDHYLPGQIRLRVENVAQIDRYPSLKKAGVFEMNSGICFINVKALQEQVFKSLIDKAFYVQSSAPKPLNSSNILRYKRIQTPNNRIEYPARHFGMCKRGFCSCTCSGHRNNIYSSRRSVGSVRHTFYLSKIWSYEMG